MGYSKDSVPDKYVGTLKGKDAKKRRAQLSRRSKMDHDDPDAYKPFSTNKGVETKPSKYTKKYKKMFGESAEKGLKKKAEASGISYGILKQVYNRGMAAWRTGHRPGATQQQWAYARVNSFITKGKTWRTADADLAKKVKAKNESIRGLIESLKLLS